MCVLLYISTRKLCYWIVIGIRIQVNYGAPPDCRRVGGHRSLPHGKSLFWSRKNTSPRMLNDPTWVPKMNLSNTITL